MRQEVHESPLNAFVERLSQSFEEVAQEEVIAPREMMSNIVDQVVNHIRIRVLPQTTSMELQLNPESLGRVNLNVTSNNGLATATLTVQNEVAKEALESQLTVLRENLESHGLKVDSVEVNVLLGLHRILLRHQEQEHLPGIFHRSPDDLLVEIPGLS